MDNLSSIVDHVHRHRGSGFDLLDNDVFGHIIGSIHNATGILADARRQDLVFLVSSVTFTHSQPGRAVCKIQL